MTDGKAVASLIGRVGLKPEIKKINETWMVKVSIAVNRSVKRNDKYDTVTTWMDLTLWGSEARCRAFINQAKVGALLDLSCKIKDNKWVSEGGETHKSFNFEIQEWIILSWPRREAPQVPSPAAVIVEDGYENFDDEAIFEQMCY